MKKPPVTKNVTTELNEQTVIVNVPAVQLEVQQEWEKGTAKLDRSRNYSVTIGQSVDCYSQDGKSFDHQGNEVKIKQEP